MLTQTNYSGQIAGELEGYRTLGQEEARKHRPPTDAARMDHNEATVLSEAEKWLGTEQRLFDVSLTEASRMATDTQQKAIEFQTTAEQLLSDNSLVSSVEVELSAERNALVKATERRLRAEA